jgi:hypothetical protein
MIFSCIRSFPRELFVISLDIVEMFIYLYDHFRCQVFEMSWSSTHETTNLMSNAKIGGICP